MNNISIPKDLYDAAYSLSEEIRDGRWRHIHDLSVKPAPACEEIISELEKRCPGYAISEYQAALARGLHDSR